LSNNTLTSSQVIGSSPLSLPSSDTKRSNTVRISESNQSETGQHGNTSVSSSAAGHSGLHGGKDVFLVDSELSGLLEVVGKDVEHELRVRVGVDVSVGLGVECLPESGGVDQVSVLRVSRNCES
jgi:hypothetical protein